VARPPWLTFKDPALCKQYDDEAEFRRSTKSRVIGGAVSANCPTPTCKVWLMEHTPNSPATGADAARRRRFNRGGAVLPRSAGNVAIPPALPLSSPGKTTNSPPA